MRIGSGEDEQYVAESNPQLKLSLGVTIGKYLLIS
jgi:hypothetical protein